MRKNFHKIISILGPTASGKSALGLSIASHLPSEIVGCDAMQIYKYLNIGTAKPDKSTLETTPHHVIDIISPNDDYNVMKYRSDANHAFEKILTHNKHPVLVGGTGLYFSTLTNNIFLEPDELKNSDITIQIKSQLQNELKKTNLPYMHEQLAKIDPQSATRIHPNDWVRIERALLVYHATKIPLSTWHERQSTDHVMKYSYFTIGLFPDRDQLYEIINKRVLHMLDHGLLNEINTLLSCGYSKTLPCFKSFSYRYFIEHIEGNLDLQDAITYTQRDTRHFAKRQITWFRKIHFNMKLTNLITKDTLEEVATHCIKSYNLEKQK